jgi:hypothetical protein
MNTEPANNEKWNEHKQIKTGGKMKKVTKSGSLVTIEEAGTISRTFHWNGKFWQLISGVQFKGDQELLATL